MKKSIQHKFFWVPLVLLGILIACSSGPSATRETNLLIASNNVVAGTTVNLHSAYFSSLSTTPEPVPAWKLNGPGALETINPYVNAFRVPEVNAVTTSKVEARYDVSEGPFSNAVTMNIHPVSSVVVGGSQGSNTLSLVPWQDTGSTFGLLSIFGDHVIVFSQDTGYTIRKFSQAGVLDTSFGQAGILTVSFLDSGPRFPYVVPGKKGFLYLISYMAGETRVQKLDAFGAIVTSFGTAGTAVTSNTLQNANGADTFVYTILDDNDNLLLMDVSLQNKSYVMSRLDAITGKRDAGFGTDGSFRLPQDFSPVSIKASQNKIFFAGLSQKQSKNGALSQQLIRLTNAGQLDTSFNTTGRLEVADKDVSFSGSGYLSRDWIGVTIQADGAILVYDSVRVGLYRSTGIAAGTESALTVTRLLSDGRIDQDFGTSGTTSVNVAGNKAQMWNRWLFADANKLTFVQQSSPTQEAPLPPLNVVTLSLRGAIEKVSRVNFEPTRVGSNLFNDRARMIDVAPLPDGSLFSVGSVCGPALTAECQLNIGISRFTP
jgi:uncharacterized delta-60 repeat protein